MAILVTKHVGEEDATFTHRRWDAMMEVRCSRHAGSHSMRPASDGTKGTSLAIVRPHHHA